jgi:cell division protein ZapA
LNEFDTELESEASFEEQGRAESVSVEIYDQVYHLRGTDPAYIQQLAAVVDAKMRAVAAMGSTVDSLRVAVLASLNIADELVMLRERHEDLVGSMTANQSSMSTLQTRSASLSGMLDAVLEEEFDGHGVRRAG